MFSFASALLSPAVMTGATGLVQGYKLGANVEERRGARRMQDVGAVSESDAALINKIFTSIADAIREDLNNASDLALGDEFIEKVKSLGLIDFTKNEKNDSEFYPVTLLRATYPIPHTESASGRVEDFFKIFDNYYHEWKGNKTDIYTASVKVLDNLTYLLFTYLDQLRRCPGSKYANAIQVSKRTAENLLCNFLHNPSAQMRGSRILELMQYWFSQKRSEFNGSDDSSVFDWFKSARAVMAVKFGKRIGDIFDESANYQRNLTVTQIFEELHDELLTEANLASEMLLRGMNELEETSRLTLNMMAAGKVKLVASSRHDVMFSSQASGKLIQALAEKRLSTLSGEHKTAVSFDAHADQGAFFHEMSAAQKFDLFAPKFMAKHAYAESVSHSYRDMLTKTMQAINTLNIAIALCNELRMEIDAYGSIGMRYTGDLQAYHAVISSLYEYSYSKLTELFKLPYFKAYVHHLKDAADGAISTINPNLVEYLQVEDNTITLNNSAERVKLILEAAMQHKKVSESLRFISAELAKLPVQDSDKPDTVFIPETNQRRAANIALIMLQNAGLSDIVLSVCEANVTNASGYFFSAVREQYAKLGEIQALIVAVNEKYGSRFMIEMPLTISQFNDCLARLAQFVQAQEGSECLLLSECTAKTKGFYLTIMCLDPSLDERKFKERERLAVQAIELRQQVVKLTGVESELHQVMESLEKSEAANQDAKGRTDRLKNSVITNLTQDVADLHKEIQDKLKLIDSIKEETGAISGMISSEQVSLEDKQQAQQRCKTLEAQIEKLRESELDLFKTKIQKIESQKATYGDEFEEIINKIDESVQSLNEARVHLVNALNDIEKLKEEITTLRARIEELVSQNYELLNVLKNTIKSQIEDIQGFVRKIKVKSDHQDEMPIDATKLASYFDVDIKPFAEKDLNFINWLKQALEYLHAQDDGMNRTNKYKAWSLFKMVCNAVSEHNATIESIAISAQDCFTSVTSQISSKNKTGDKYHYGSKEKILLTEIERLSNKKLNPASNPALFFNPGPNLSGSPFSLATIKKNSGSN